MNQLPKRPNQLLTKHWRYAWKEKNVWRDLIGAATCGKRPKAPLKKAKLKLVRYSNRAPDPDGLVSSFKYVLDALIFFEIIKDDSMKIIGMPQYDWMYAKKNKGKISVSVWSNE